MKLFEVQFHSKIASLFVLCVLSLGIWAQTKEDREKQKTPVTPQVPTRRIPLGEKSRVTLADVNVEIVSDPRVIVTMAALNAAGFDFEPGSRTLSPLRRQLREDLKNIDPSLSRRLHEYFVSHNKGRALDASAVAPYLSLALTMSAPPTFTIDVATEKLPEEVREIADFALLLEEFYRTTKFSLLLPKYKQAHELAARSYGTFTATAVANVIQYLHTEPILELPPSYVARIQTAPRVAIEESLRAQNRVRRFVISPDLLDASNAVNLRVIRDTYYVFLGASVDANDAVRRSFLRFVIDPLVERQVKEVREIGPDLRKLAESRGEKLAADYKNNNAYFQIADSLTRAIDVRIKSLETLLSRRLTDDKAFVKAMEEENERAIYELSLAYDRGAVLVYHFYDQIKQAESAGIDLRQYLPTLLTTIKFDIETARLTDYAQRLERYKAQRELAAKNAPNLSASISNADQEIVTKLDEADRLIRGGQYDDARAILRAIIGQRPNNARAYYGLAEISSKVAARIDDRDKRDEELFAAVQYFKDAAENAAPQIEQWLIQRSYVGAAKILDFLGHNEDAMAAYDLAVKIGDVPNGAYQEAIKAVKARQEQKEKP